MEHMSRRDALKFGAGAAAAAGAASVAVDMASANAASGATASGFDDEMFDVDAVEAGLWVPGPYGPDDQRGSLNEITPESTAWAVNRLRGGPVTAYQLGEEMFNGFPAFPSDPPRLHDMFLLAAGYEAPQEFVDGGGIQGGFLEPLGASKLTAHEERFAENFTFQIATQLDGLNHVGVGQMYYNGFLAEDIITPTGTTALGNETMGPIATRGIILDIIGLKVAAGATDCFFIADNGRPVLNDNYRITIDDIENAMFRQRITPGIRAGDVPIFHTGWTHLARQDPDRYLAQEPGIYLAEARYLAARKCSIIASDTWGVEVRGNEVHGPNAFPVHQELFLKYGTRLGEAFVTDAAIDDGCYEGLLVITPENVPGATCGSSAPTLLCKPGRPVRP
jgi:kynurenine formamidase